MASTIALGPSAPSSKNASPHVTITSTPANKPTPLSNFCERQVNTQEGKKAYPNIVTLVRKGANLPSTVDMIEFHGSQRLKLQRGLRTDDITGKSPADAVLFIVERVDAAFMDVVSRRCGQDVQNSLAQFLEDYLDSPPWYNYREVERHLPRWISPSEPRKHINLEFIGARELESVGTSPLRGERIWSPPASWWTIYDRKAGGFKPIERTDPGKKSASFADVALVCHHLGAWFDLDWKGNWKTGVILGDPLFESNPVAIWKPPILKDIFHTSLEAAEFGKDWTRAMKDNQTHQTILTELMKMNPLTQDVGTKTALAEIHANLSQSIDLLLYTTERSEQGIQLLTSLLSVADAEESIAQTNISLSQNQILLLLTAVATFFLPINSISAILNMQGEWAPNNHNFPFFWLISMPISCILLLVVFRPLRKWIREFRESKGAAVDTDRSKATSLLP